MLKFLYINRFGSSSHSAPIQLPFSSLAHQIALRWCLRWIFEPYRQFLVPAWSAEGPGAVQFILWAVPAVLCPCLECRRPWSGKAWFVSASFCKLWVSVVREIPLRRAGSSLAAGPLNRLLTLCRLLCDHVDPLLVEISLEEAEMQNHCSPLLPCTNGWPKNNYWLLPWKNIFVF